MAISDSRRLNIVLPYLYPDLNNVASGTWNYEDYSLQNDTDGRGTYIIWKTDAVTEPTAQQLADGKEAAINDYWWKRLRKTRDKLLVESDWSQGTDVPSALKSSYATYRTDLRDLPTTVTKPDFATLNNQEVFDWKIDDLMPTKP